MKNPVGVFIKPCRWQHLFKRCMFSIKYLSLNLLIGLLSTGCATYYAAISSPPPDLNRILQGIPRKSVEKVLGTPKVQTNNVSYYEYNKEDWPIVASFFADFLTMGATIFFASDAHQAQRETIGILYSPEDTVVGISFSEVEAQYRKWLQSENQDKELNDLCLTANLGYGPAQAVQGARYQYGLWNTKVDNKKAYLWFELAEFGGQKNAKKAITTLSKKLSSTEIAEINKQFSNWTPGSCDNELITGKDVHNSILSP